MYERYRRYKQQKYFIESSKSSCPLINSILRLVINPTKKNPATIPVISGIVFFHPYFVPFMEHKILFGPGE
jgi:hypothetical protein